MTALTTNSIKTASPGVKRAEALPGFWLGTALVVLAVLRWAFPAESGVSSRPAAARAEYRGRSWQLPAERRALTARMRTPPSASEDHRSCLRLLPTSGAGLEASACLTNTERWVWGLPLDLNRATAAELSRLPGIGPKGAERILAERDREGGFRSVEEVWRRHELPEETRAALRQWFMVEGTRESDGESSGQAL